MAAPRSRTAGVAHAGLWVLASLPVLGLAGAWLLAESSGYLGLLETVALAVGVLATGGSVAVGARHFGAREPGSVDQGGA